MSEYDDLHSAMMKVTARAMALETLVLALVAHYPEKMKVLNAFEHELENQSATTLFESELKNHPEKDLPVAQDHLLAQVAALCAAG
jgi:hypothetical protein